MLLRELVEKKRVCFHQSFPNWEAAVTASCQPLINDGSIEQAYVDAVIRCVKEFGPYIVFAPKIAMPHTQRGAVGVHNTAMSFMKVEEPVSFQEGNPEKDAYLFFTVAALDKEEHLKNMEALAELLMTSPEMIEELLQAKNEKDLLALDEKYSK